MHRLFGIECLAHEICSHVSYYDLPVLARVASIWFRCAIPRLYKEVEIRDALAPLDVTIPEHEIDDEDLKFLPVPSDESFKRFLKYSPHVRSLNVDINSIDIIFVAMRKSVSRGLPYLFPNLQNLTWIVFREYSAQYMEVSAALLSPKIKRLSLYLTNDRIFHYLGPLIMTHLPALRFVTIGDAIPTRRTGRRVGESRLVKPAQDLLTFFAHTLTSVDISLSLNTTSIVECLSNMPNLCNLAIGNTDMEEKKSSSNKIDGDAEKFHSLRYFSFDGTSQSLYDMFLKPYRLASLTVLSFKVKFPTPADVNVIVLSIVVACPRIMSLTIGSDLMEAWNSYVWPVVPWSFIQPISSCKELTALSLNMMRVSVNIEELMAFIECRTTWTCLHLLTSNPLRLHDMLLYAKHCPTLEHLGIHINLNDCLEFRINDLPVDLPTFPSLTSIDFGGSRIASSRSYYLVRFLHRICKKPLYSIRGLGHETNDYVLRNLAIYYLNEKYRTGRPISDELREFATTVLNEGGMDGF